MTDPVEQSKDLKVLYEDIVELNDKLQGKDCKIQLLQAQWNLENVKLNDTIRRLRKEIELLSKRKDEMELELNNELQSKEAEIRKCQNQVEETMEMKDWFESKSLERSKDLKILRESKDSLNQSKIVELNDKLQGKDRKIQLLQAQWK